ncbi:uncharacterized protein LOC132750587 [Ruditapes philippinarum]|uniref:uncharacterized protein LOC132750587 n=1 Tax=Ruditapes philippinarum TaxID=129788 RepID=UPI00295A6E28|nr:uncharacterized protein LOC132750587 [Ruditapes philippinarum]
MERLTSSSDYTSLTMEVTGRTSRENDISYKDSERTNAIINCDPCGNEGGEQLAEGFCENCQEYLCASCYKIHRRPAVWRHHVLLDKENMPSSKTTKEQLNYECTEPCSEHSTKVLEYFCQTHSQLGCPVCITTKHRLCNDVDYIPGIANQFRESTEVKETYETLQSLKEDINTYSATLSVDKMKIKTYEKNAKEHILQLRDEFDSICNRLVDNVEHVSKCDENNIEDSLKTCEEILKNIKLRQSVLEKKQAEMKISQLFTEAKLSELSAEEYRRELETIKECTKSRHYEIKCDIEALREMIKLTFRDKQNENDPLCAKVTSEYEYPQKNTIKHGHIHNLDSMAGNKEENEEKKSGGAWGHSIYPMPQVTNAAHAGTSANTKYQQKNYGSHVQYGTNKMYDNLTGQSSGDFSKSHYGTSQAQPKANCMGQPISDDKGGFKPNNLVASPPEFLTLEEFLAEGRDGKTSPRQKLDNKKEKEEKKSGGAWGHSIYPVTRKAFDKAENISQISKISGDAWGHSKSKGNWDTYEKETTDYKKSVDSSEHSKSEVSLKNVGQIIKMSGDALGHSRSKGSWDTYEKETTDYKTSIDSSEHSKSEVNWKTNDKKENEDKTEYLYGNDKWLNKGPQQEQYQTRRTKKNNMKNKKGQKGRRYEESQIIAMTQ